MPGLRITGEEIFDLRGVAQFAYKFLVKQRREQGIVCQFSHDGFVVDRLALFDRLLGAEESRPLLLERCPQRTVGKEHQGAE